MTPPQPDPIRTSTSDTAVPRRAAGLVPSVSRAVALLDLLAQERTPMGLARLASRLDLPKSSVHALCNTLLTLGYLRRQGESGYLIGPRVMPLADAFVSGIDVAQAFTALWEGLGAPDETVILSVLDGIDVVYVAARSGIRPLGLAFRVGMRLPAHLAATGRAMLAYRSEDEVRATYGSRPLPSLQRGAAMSLDDLLAELERTRQRGHSIDDEGVREGVYCLGAPVFDTRAEVVAGVGVCLQKASADAPTRARHLGAVLQAAHELTQRIGGRLPVRSASATTPRTGTASPAKTPAARAA